MIGLLTTFKISLEKMQGSLLGNHSLRAFAKHSLCEIAPPHIFIVQNCDRLFTTLSFSLEKNQEIAFAKHSPCAIAPNDLDKFPLRTER
ncbi:hypothetical protein CENA302_10350 [Cylindrospermopsis raciborskii CENA302]|uniref:Uncharacterized protein n=1 Tax=Cylindrospermopsis raciborskii CENA302 TaxID=1170768 RepID=A0A9Q5QWE6_9CYAN|nr:hypothetical protein CENA302_10350 [Cylindrospermopsis raciborskii CENA302]